MLKKMMKAGALAGVIFGFVAGAASATAPAVTIDPIGPLAFATFPQVYNVTGTLEHHQGGVNSISELVLFVDGSQEGSTVDPEVAGNPSSTSFSLPWTIGGPGTYTVRVTARHGNDTGEDTITVTVSVVEVASVDESCGRAAPAIASDYMRNDLGLKPNQAEFRAVMRSVARETGARGVLAAPTKCADWEEYAQATRDLVDNLLAD